MGQPLKEWYDPENGVHDAIACDIVTTTLEIPGVREAVMDYFAEKYAGMSLRTLQQEWGVELVTDIPFQVVWAFIFGQEEF